MCKIYTVTIEETVVQDFEVEAETESQALDIAKKKYNDCEFVLEPGEIAYKQIKVKNSSNNQTQWKEF